MTPNLINETDVSISALEALLDRAFIRHRLDEDGDLYLTSGIAFHLWIGVEADQRTLRFLTFARRDAEEAPFTADDAHKMNRMAMGCAFYLVEGQPQRLYAIVLLSIDGGVLESQIIATARSLADAVARGTRSLEPRVLQ